MKTNRISFYICKFSYIISGIIFILMFFLCAVNKIVVTNNSGEYVNFYIHKYNYFFSAALIIALVLFLKHMLSNIKANMLFAIFSAVYIVVGIYLIVNVEPVLKADAAVVFDISRALNANNYSVFDLGGYLSRHPHQLGLSVYESLLLKIYDSVYTVYIANLIHTLLINYFLMKITDILFDKNETVNKYVMIFSFLFLPQLLFVVFPYGHTAGLSFMLIAAYML